MSRKLVKKAQRGDCPESSLQDEDEKQLAEFCEGFDFDDISVDQWLEADETLDLTVTLAISLEDAKSGGKFPLRYTQTVDGERIQTELSLTIAEGVKESQVIVVPGKGDCRDGRAGDLRVIIRLKPDS